MPISPFYKKVRDRVGHDLWMIPVLGFGYPAEVFRQEVGEIVFE